MSIGKAYTPEMLTEPDDKLKDDMFVACPEEVVEVDVTAYFFQNGFNQMVPNKKYGFFFVPIRPPGGWSSTGDCMAGAFESFSAMKAAALALKARLEAMGYKVVFKFEPKTPGLPAVDLNWGSDEIRTFRRP